jgi:2-amino-4-hydroxy-6-hydroxymethyldihydropteridine diphosphokinase
MHQVYLALGANLGNRWENLQQGLNCLGDLGTVEKISCCYETEPIGYLDQPFFLNIACLFSTELDPHTLLQRIKNIEEQMGRLVSFRNAPRPIDIDIILFDDIVMDSPELIIPHPRMSERAFVLVPLADIAPEVVHPTLSLAIHELLQKVNCRGIRLFHE